MKTILSSAALAASLALAGTAQAAAPLRISLTADIRSTEPGVNRDSNSDAVVLHIVEGLVAYGEDAEVRPCWRSRWTSAPTARPTPSRCVTASGSTTARR